MADEPAKIILGDTVISAVEEPGRRRFFAGKISDLLSLIVKIAGRS